MARPTLTIRPEEVLTCRLTDRPIRPLFQMLVLTKFVQTAVPRRTCEMILNSLASSARAPVMVSDIPWAGPLGAVRVGRVNGKFVRIPTQHTEMKDGDLDLVYVGNETDIVMYERGG